MKRKICLFLAVIIIFTSMPLSAYAATELDKDKFDTDVDFMKNVIYFVLGQYQYDVDQEDVMNGLYDGFFGVLDEYSVYYTPEEYQSMVEDTAGEFSGIGVQIVEKNGHIEVVTPLPGTPAIEAGIKSGDIIKYVDGVDITGFTVDKASSIIKGTEGTKVTLGIIRGTENLTFELTRRTIITSTVEGKILDGNIGYLKITEFADNTVELTKKQLDTFDENNVKEIVLDLRNNGGGTLDSAIDMLNMFVTEGPVVYVDYATGDEEVYSSDLKEQKYEMALLINGGSASATEIFAGAVKYKKEGTVIGTQSYGKGIVQSLFHLKNGGGVKFTTAEYFSVDRTPVHKIGITPDIVVENPSIELSKYGTFSLSAKPVLGNVSLDVLTAEMILQTLGYKVGTPDGVYDSVSFECVKEFQKNSGLYPYGTIDYATQNSLYSALTKYAATGMEDLQLKTAIEQLKSN
jgi:carboxyl-terminal processing protease